MVLQRDVYKLNKYTKSHGISHDSWLANFLLRYRFTPHSVTGVTPCQLFLKRLLKPSLEREIERDGGEATQTTKKE